MNLLDYLPNFLQDTKEFKKLFEAGDIEYARLMKEINSVFENQYVNDATEVGVKRWEEMLSIIPKDTDNLADRKFRIITTLNAKVPYTYRTLEKQLIALLGKDNFTMSFQQSTYTLKIRIALTVKKQIDELETMINKMLPANITLDFDLLYNRHIDLAEYTHEHLSAYTQDGLRNEALK